MDTERYPLSGATPGNTRELTVLRFGPRGGRPRAYLQAALHADEPPGLLVMYHLRRLLAEAEAAGRLLGEVLLVPAANPIGLSQRLWGQTLGRFSLADGVNFNRGFLELATPAARLLEGQLGADAGDNTARVREALLAVLRESVALSEVEQLKQRLLELAIDSDVVLDLHCDNDAVLHLYTHAGLAEEAGPLARLLGARVVLLAEVSGDEPFDEACSRPWFELRRRFPDAVIPAGCFSATVELRGETDVDHASAEADAQALLDFLQWRGLLSGAPRPLPPAAGEATPLAGSEPLVAPISGVVVYHRQPGDTLQAGETVAEVIDPVSGEARLVLAGISGLLYARLAQRFVGAGQRLAKVAGRQPTRQGKLLSP